MTTTKKDPVVVVFQLTGANDYLNTIIPYTDPHYRDARPRVGIPEDQVLPIDDQLAFNPNMGPVKELYDQGKVAIIHGIGYENSPRSHFRSMDIWHTCEPDKVGTEGWAGKVIRDLDPAGENVLKGINFGQGLPRALALRGVPVTSVSNLESYGVMSDVPGMAGDRDKLLERFAPHVRPRRRRRTHYGLPWADWPGRPSGRGYPEGRAGKVLFYGGVRRHAHRQEPKEYRPGVPGGPGHPALLHTAHGSFDTHFNQPPMHTKLWIDTSRAISDFFLDLQEHNAGENLIMVMFTEFGRRVRDNGTGTDHGAGGVAFVIGDQVNGGMYSDYPSLKPEDLQQGDLAPNYDFRGFYATVVDKWLGLDPGPDSWRQFRATGLHLDRQLVDRQLVGR